MTADAITGVQDEGFDGRMGALVIGRMVRREAGRTGTLCVKGIVDVQCLPGFGGQPEC